MNGCRNRLFNAPRCGFLLRHLSIAYAGLKDVLRESGKVWIVGLQVCALLANLWFKIGQPTGMLRSKHRIVLFILTETANAITPAISIWRAVQQRHVNRLRFQTNIKIFSQVEVDERLDIRQEFSQAYGPLGG